MPAAARELIGSFVHLKKKPHSQEALCILRRVAAHVTPIMQSRGWHVTTLAEFFPTQTNLLGTNYGKGKKISLRLRPHYNESEFMSFEDVIGTMLHELTHNECGPHDAKFYALLDDLNLEYDKLLASGFKGNDGESLGGRSLSIADAKKAALARAARASMGTGSDGKKLGGQMSADTSAREIRSRVAIAAQRRLHDAKWCGHGHAEDPILVDEEEENTNSEVFDRVSASEPVLDNETVLEASIRQQHIQKTSSKDKEQVDIIEINSDDDDDDDEPAANYQHLLPKISNGQKRSHSRDVEASDDYKRMKSRGLIADSLYDHLKKLKSSTSSTSDNLKDMEALVPADRWQCEVCTLINPLALEQCAVCEAQRPAKRKRGEYWICECHMSNEWSTWMCSKCQRIKKTS